MEVMTSFLQLSWMLSKGKYYLSNDLYDLMKQNRMIDADISPTTTAAKLSLNSDDFNDSAGSTFFF